MAEAQLNILWNILSYCPSWKACKNSTFLPMITWRLWLVSHVTSLTISSPLQSCYLQGIFPMDLKETTRTDFVPSCYWWSWLSKLDGVVVSSVNSSPAAVEIQELKTIEQTGLEENIPNKIIKIFASKNLNHQLFFRELWPVLFLSQPLISASLSQRSCKKLHWLIPVHSGPIEGTCVATSKALTKFKYLHTFKNTHSELLYHIPNYQLKQFCLRSLFLNFFFNFLEGICS